jgi:hypothetical protein
MQGMNTHLWKIFFKGQNEADQVPRSRMFRSAVKKWSVEGDSDRSSTPQEQGPTLFQQERLYIPAEPDPSRSLWIPESIITSKTGQSFRCSFSALGTMALQTEIELSTHTGTAWAPHDMELCQAIFDLKLESQQSEEQIRAIRTELQSIQAEFEEHEKEIEILQEEECEDVGGLDEISPNEIETIDEEAWDSEEENHQKCRSRRRGRIFPCARVVKVPHSRARKCSRIPIRAVTNTHSSAFTYAESPELSTARSWPHLVIPNDVDQMSVKIERHESGRSQDRDSGYGSPISTHCSGDIVFTPDTRLDPVREGVEG